MAAMIDSPIIDISPLSDASLPAFCGNPTRGWDRSSRVIPGFMTAPGPVFLRVVAFYEEVGCGFETARVDQETAISSNK